MSFQIGTTSRFKRRLRKFTRSYPQHTDDVAALLRDLQVDPFQPHLRLHQLSGKLEEFHAVRLTHSFRVILMLMPDERKIALVDIGSHDEVYR